MKTILESSLVALAVGAGAVLASSPLALAGEKEVITEIKKLYAKIDESKPAATTKIKFDLPGDPMEGTITRFTYKNGLMAIKLSYIAGDHGGADEHYYYHNNEPFFIFVKEAYWQFASDDTAEKPTSVDILTESRYYLHEGLCVRALRKSVRGPDAKKLPKLIAKTANQEIETGSEDEKRLLKWAKGLRKISSSEEAVKFFSRDD